MSAAWDMLERSGPVGWTLLVLSVLSLTVIAVRVLALRGSLSGGPLRDAALARWPGDRPGAIAALEAGARSPADRILLQAMKAPATPRPVLEADLEWRGNAEVMAATRHIRLLELVAMISPLLGLLGTVLGMIQSFQSLALAEGAANAALLAGGIWVALLTTAAGLLVAIPSAVAASFLTVRGEAIAQSIEAAIGRFFAIEATTA